MVRETGQAAAATYGKLFVETGATIHLTGNYYVGNPNNTAGDVIQNGGAITLGGQLRLGHWSGEVSTYTMSGAGLTLGALPAGYLYALDTRTAGQVILRVQADSVGDGIPNQWRQQYFGGDGTTTNGASCATCDPDGDGADNNHEYTADTNPTNALSVFHVQGLVVSNSAAVVFPSSTQRAYTLYYTRDLLTGDWTNLPNQTDIPGAGTNALLDSTITRTQRFYRVGVRLP